MAIATSIKAKFVWLAFVILLLIAGMILAGRSGINRIEQHGRVTITAEALTASLRELLQGLAETVVIPDTPQTIATARKGIASFDAGLELLRELIDTPELRSIIDKEIAPVWGEAKGEAQSLLDRKRLNPDDVEVMIAFGKLAAKSEKLLASTKKFTELSASETTREVAVSKALLGGMAAAVLLVAVLFFYFFYRSLVDPLRELSASARGISEGQLDLTVDTRRHDELGDVARSFAVMISSLAQTIHKTSEINASIAATVSSAGTVVEEISEAVRVQKQGVDQSVSSVDELHRSFQSVSENIDALNTASVDSANAIRILSTSLAGVMRDSQDFYAEAERTVGEVREMIESSEVIARGVDGLKRFANDSSQTIGMIEQSLGSTRSNAEEAMLLARKVSQESTEIGIESVRNALEGMEQLEENVLALTETVDRFGRKSTEIGKIVTVIDEITTQTRLLALNASIIAAQAGAHGKGFAVVADEIRALADRTSLSTREIGEVVSSVQTEIEAGIEQAREGEKAVRAGKALVAKVNENLETIHQSANLSAVKVAEILAAADTETVGISAMARAVMELNGQILRISEKVRAHQRGNSEIFKVLEVFVATAANIKGATAEQQLAGESIAAAAQQVADLSRQILATIAEQRATTDVIIDVIHTMNDSSGRLLATTERLSANILPLTAKADSLSAELRWFKLGERHD